MSSHPLFTAYPLEDYRRHQADIDASLQRMLANGHYILGPDVEAFEKEFAAFVGVKQAVGVANGTDSIELILRALGIGRGDRVAVVSHTAVASVSAIARAGAQAVFVDIEPDTMVMSADHLQKVLQADQSRTIKAVLAVHLYGHPVDLAAVGALCAEHGAALVEDCAQAHGARFQGKHVGSIGVAGSFSFYPTKNLGAIGDGGAVTTDDEALAARVRQLRQYGWKQRYISDIEGINSRLDEMQAALLRVKLRTLDEAQAARRRLAARYAEKLAGLPLQLPVICGGCVHAYHLFVIRCDRRDALMAHLLQAGVPAALHYPAAVHQQPAYAGLVDPRLPLVETDRAYREILSLPLHPWMEEAAVDVASEAVRGFFA